MSSKRDISNLDPEYEDITEHQNKRQRQREQDAKEATVRKIETIIRQQFMEETQNKEQEISLIDQRLQQARRLLDRLRACIVARYYSKTNAPSSVKSLGKQQYEPPSIHPAVQKFLGKAPRETGAASSDGDENQTSAAEVGKKSESEELSKTAKKDEQEETTGLARFGDAACQDQGRGSRFKVKRRVVVGNVSKYIPVDKREGNDQATHKWMVYVRGPREQPHIEEHVAKVWFFLHPSYKPNDLVEVSQPPFHLTRRGWGEFPLRVQLHFVDQRNKRVDIIHRLRLDKSYTGLQTLGGETVVDVELERNDPVPRSSLSLLSSALGKRSAPENKEGEKPKRQKRSSGATECEVREMTIPASPSTGKASPAPSDTSSFMSSLCRQMSSTPDSQPPESPLRSSTPLTTSDSGNAPLTPSKTDGWMHFQIKKEPTSPAPQLIPAASPRSVFVKTEAGISGRDSPVHRRTIGAGSRIGRVSPMTPVCSADASRLPSPVTPTKDWTHVQIKSEPTSPVPVAGWQNFSSLTSPTRPPSLGALSPPPAKSASPLHKVVGGGSARILSPPLPVSEKPSPVKPVTMNIGSIGSKMAASPVLPTSTLTSVVAPITKQSTQVATITSPSVTVSAHPPRPALTPPTRPGGMLIIQPPVATAAAAPRLASPQLPGPRQSQATVFVKCMDNQGKIYLIPQHLLTKTIGGLTPGPAATLRLPAVTSSVPALTTMTASPPGVMQTNSLLRGASPAGQTVILQRPLDPGQKTPTQPVVLQLPGTTGLQISSPGAARKPRPSTTSATLRMGDTAMGPGIAALQTSPRFQTTPSVSASSSSLLLASPNPSVVRTPTGGLAQLAAAASLLEATPIAKSTTPSSKTSDSLVVMGDLSRTALTKTPKPADLMVLASALRPANPTAAVAKHRDNLVVFGPRVATANVGAGKAGENLVVLGSPAGGAVRFPAGVGKTGDNVLMVSGGLAGKSSILLVNSDQGKSAVGKPVAGAGNKTGTVSLLSGQFSAGKPSVTVGGTSPRLTAGLVTSASKSNPQLLMLQTPSQSVLAATTSVATGLAQTRVPGSAVISTSTSAAASAPVSLLLPQASSSPRIVTIQPRPDGMKSAADVRLAATADIVKAPTKRTIVGNNAMRLHRDTKPAAVKEPEWKNFHRDLDVSDYVHLEELVNAVVQQYPLVAKDADRSVYPYCAATAEQHLTWNIGKRRAAEWQRAVAVRRRVLKMLQDEDAFPGETLGSTKQIMRWCRTHGYSPLDTVVCSRLTREVRPLQSAGLCINSYSSSAALLQLLEETAASQPCTEDPLEEPNETIDILSLDSAPQVKKTMESPRKDTRLSEVLPAATGVTFVRETAQQIGVRLRPVEVDPASSPGVYGCLAEEMILAAMKKFMDGMLRNSVSVIMKEKRMLEEVSVADIHKAVMTSEHCDFLTNQGLGVPDDRTETGTAGKVT